MYSCTFGKGWVGRGSLYFFRYECPLVVFSFQGLTCMHCVYLALWTCKVLCGRFLCAIFKFSPIHSFIHSFIHLFIYSLIPLWTGDQATGGAVERERPSGQPDKVWGASFATPGSSAESPEKAESASCARWRQRQGRRKEPGKCQWKGNNIICQEVAAEAVVRDSAGTCWRHSDEGEFKVVVVRVYVPVWWRWV